MFTVAKSLATCALVFASLAIACQSVAQTSTPRIQPEDIIVAETRQDAASPTATLAGDATATTDPTQTALPATNTPTPTATPMPTAAPVTPSPTTPSLVATVTPNPTFEALRATPTPLPTATPTPETDPVRERKVFRVPISNIVVPDPVFGDYGESSTLHFEIFSGLTAFTLDASAPVRLDMASSHTIGSGGTTHTFVLRPGLKFSDGSPVAASDFKWSWERALLTAARVDVATQAEWVLAPILGAQEMLDGEASELRGVTAVDERTLAIELTAPRYDLEALLAHPAAAVLKRDNVEDWNVDWSTRVSGHLVSVFSPAPPLGPESLPVGTGPFKLTVFDEDNELYIIERNDHYHGEPPQLDAVQLDAKALTDAWDYEGGPFAGIEVLFESGGIDASIFPTNVVMTSDGALPEGFATVGVNPTTMLIVFNPSIPPFDDLDFRRALAAAIDTDAFLKAFGGSRPTGIVPSSDPGYSEASFPIEFDLEAADESFNAFSGRNPGTLDEVTWIFGSTGAREKERVAIASGWQRTFPIEFILEQASTREFQRLRRDNELSLLLLGHQATYPHPQASVIDFSELFGEGAVSDDIEAANAMAQRAASEADPVTALQLYSDLEQYLLDNALVVPLSLSAGTSFSVRVQPWVHGYQVGRYGGSRFKDVWFDETYPGPR